MSLAGCENTRQHSGNETILFDKLAIGIDFGDVPGRDEVFSSMQLN